MPTKNTRTAEPAGEEQFLKQQAAQARAAATATLRDIGAGFGQSVDPRAWTGEHPWAAVATAAIAGFAAAAFVVPSKRSQALGKIEELERALQMQPNDPRDGRDYYPMDAVNGDRRSRDRSGLLATLLRDLMKTVVAVSFSAITNMIGQWSSGEPDAAAQDAGKGPTDDSSGVSIS